MEKRKKWEIHEEEKEHGKYMGKRRNMENRKEQWQLIKMVKIENKTKNGQKIL